MKGGREGRRKRKRMGGGREKEGREGGEGRGGEGGLHTQSHSYTPLKSVSAILTRGFVIHVHVHETSKSTTAVQVLL